jgi:hypothetical protein
MGVLVSTGRSLRTSYFLSDIIHTSIRRHDENSAVLKVDNVLNRNVFGFLLRHHGKNVFQLLTVNFCYIP